MRRYRCTYKSLGWEQSREYDASDFQDAVNKAIAIIATLENRWTFLKCVEEIGGVD